MNVTAFLGRLCIAICSLTAVSSWADPPGRVGRIAYISGAVSFFGDRDEGWRKAQINHPVTTENSLWTEKDSLVEVRVGPSAIRLDGDSVFDLVKLEDDLAQGYLQRGSVNVRLRQFGNPEAGDALQINTREGRFLLEGNGRYRLDVPADGGESRLSVFYGKARFDSVNEPATHLPIEAGKQLTVRTNGSATDFRFEAVSETPFDRWAGERDRQWDLAIQRNAQNAAREAELSPYMTGAEDLDAYGDWVNDAEYGRLWAPRAVVAGWAPYRYGRWSYVLPWGWTWIDDAPWGFAPFHYGRWVQVRARWCWWPGRHVGRPVYAPALVAWIGGPGAGLTISSGPAVGWFPLAPREYYVPRYTANPHYHRRINHVANNSVTIQAPARYRNQVPGATIVANQVFINGNNVGSRATHVPPHVIAGHTPAATPDTPRPPPRIAPVAPDRQNGNRPARPAPRPAFANENPPASLPAAVRPPTATQSPRARSAESGGGVPLPAHRTSPEAVHSGALPLAITPNALAVTPTPQAATPAAPAVTPAAPPAPSARQRPMPAPVPQVAPVPPAYAGAPGSPPVKVETAPPGRERNARPMPPAQGTTPYVDTPRQNTSTRPVPAPVAAPAAVPRAPSGVVHTAPPPVVHAAPPITNAPAAKASKPQPDAQAEGSPDKREPRDRLPKPPVAKD